MASHTSTDRRPSSSTNEGKKENKSKNTFTLPSSKSSLRKQWEVFLSLQIHFLTFSGARSHSRDSPSVRATHETNKNSVRMF